MRRTESFFAAALLAAVAACADAPTGPAAAGGEIGPGAGPALAMNAAASRVVAYLPTWYGGSLDSIRYDKLTHINYAFLEPTTSGGLTGISMSGDTRLTSLVQKAHAAGVKVLVSVGGWTGSDDSSFEPMAASSTARAAFVSNLVTFVGNYGLDGVDIDWEFPESGTEAASYALLMSELDTAMHSRGKLLTAAVAANGYYGSGVPGSVFGNVDFLVLMAYDGGTPHSTYAYAEASLDYWSGRGLPVSRTVLGVPFYGSNSAGTQKAYRSIVRDDAQAPYKDDSNGFYYNGVQTIKQKTVLSLQRASGVGIWEITQDTTLAGISLLGAIHEAMNGTRVVYDDALGAGWQNWSWDVTVNFAATSPVHLGSKSVAATFTGAWGGVYLHHGTGISPSGLGRLEFYVHGGTSGGHNLVVYLGDTAGWRTMVAVNSYVAGGSVAAGAWRRVSIPLSALGITSYAITDLVIHDNSGGAQPVFYVDQLQFLP